MLCFFKLLYYPNKKSYLHEEILVQYSFLIHDTKHGVHLKQNVLASLRGDELKNLHPFLGFILSLFHLRNVQNNNDWSVDSAPRLHDRRAFSVKEGPRSQQIKDWK